MVAFSPPIQNLPVKFYIQSTCQNLTRNTRKRKTRLADDLASYIEIMGMSSDQDQIDVILLSLQKLNLLEKTEFVGKPTKAGCKLTSVQTRKTIWEFCRRNWTQSILTSHPAELKVKNKPNIPIGLDYINTVAMVRQRNKSFFSKPLADCNCDKGIIARICLQFSWRCSL